MSQTQPSPPNSNNAFLSREVRVFISSTFKDMEAERNYLLGTIFPEIAQTCRERGVGFTEIDLRWGVTEEESKNGRAVEICLEQINECREYPPFFIGLLGERYGWIPVHQELDQYWDEHADSPYALRIKAALEQGISVTELEMQYGILDNPHNADHARVFLRSAEFTEQLARLSGAAGGNAFHEDPSNQQDKLKETLRNNHLVAVDGYSSLEELGAAIKAFMLPQIERLYPKAQAPTRQQQRDNDHAFYAASRRKGYVALPSMRPKVLDFIEKATGQSSAEHHAAQCLLIHGASGRGKTAFIADLELELSKQQIFWAHTHYLGADGDLSLSGWLDRLSSALQSSGKLSQPLPDKMQDQWEALPNALFEVQTRLDLPVVLLLDAFDQCREPDAVERLRSLVASLPPKVCLLITVTTDRNPKLPRELVLELELPALDTEQRKAAIDAFLDNYGKKIPDEILDSLVHSESCAEPLFLRLLLEELRLHARHETLENLSQTLLQCADAGTMFKRALMGMDEDFANARHPELATRTAHLLAASYRGLSKTDLALLLGQAGDPIDPVSQKPRLPDVILGPVLARLDPYSLRNVGRSFIMHAILRNALLEQASTTQIRHELISHFSGEETEALVERIFQWFMLDDRSGLLSLQGLGKLEHAIALQHQAPILFNQLFYKLKAYIRLLAYDLTEVAQHWANSLDLSEWRSEGRLREVLLFQKAFPQVSDLSRPLLEALVDVGTAVLGKHHAIVAEALNNLACLYQDQGHIKAAKDIYEQAIAIVDQDQVGSSQLLAAIRSNLASVYQELGQFVDALPLLKRALSMREQTLESPHLDIATSLDNLAGWYLDKGERIEAMRYSFDHSRKIEAIQEADWHYEQAKQLFMRALEIRRRVLGFDSKSPIIAQSLHNLASLSRNQNKIDDALCYQWRSLEFFTLAMGPQHPNVIKSLSSMAGLYELKGKYIEENAPFDQMQRAKTLHYANVSYNESLSFYERALEISKQVLGEKHPVTANILFNLATSYKMRENYDKALPMFKNALEIYEHELKETDPKVMTLLDAIATIYQEKGECQEAIPYLERLLNISNI